MLISIDVTRPEFVIEGDEQPVCIAYVIDESGHIAQAHDKVDARAYPKQQLEML